MPKLDRSNFLESVSSDFGLEKNLITNSILEFQPSRPEKLYKIQQIDVGRPDLISYRFYRSTNYWWFLMKYNGIDDVFNEMYINMPIRIPAETDIVNFLNG